MNARELVDGLRELADRVEPHVEHFGDVWINATVWAHCQDNRHGVLTAVRLMDSPEPNNTHGNHWIKGGCGEIELVAHYSPGLLGETRREELRTVVVEDTPDIAALLAEEVAHAV